MFSLDTQHLYKKLTLTLLLLSAVTLAIITLAPEVSAQECTVEEAALSGGLVPCSGNGCGTCELVSLANRVVDFIIEVTLVIVTIIFMYGGFLMVTSQGNRSQYEQGKGRFVDAFIGLVILLTAWLIVDLVMRTFLPGGMVDYGAGQLPWQQIQCTDQVQLCNRVGETTHGDPWAGVGAYDASKPAEKVLPSADGSCPIGYEKVDNRPCQRRTTPLQQNADGSCPIGYVKNDGKCDVPTGPISPSPGGACPPGHIFDAFGDCQFQSSFAPQGDTGAPIPAPRPSASSTTYIYSNHTRLF